MKRPIFFILVFLVFSIYKEASCTVKTALATSNDWEDGNKWSTGTAPTCGDTLIIPAGKTVIVQQQDNYTGCGSKMVILISGTLTFATGKKLMLPCGSYLAIKSGGKLDPGNGGGSSNLIDICNVTEWKAGDGTLNGPYCVPENDPSCSAALPVELIQLSAELNQNHSVLVKWITATEVNNDYFEISRSSDAVNFETLGTEKGNGNSTMAHYYSYVDDGAFFTGPFLYYRLKQVDYDGHYKYYGPVAVKSTGEMEFEVFPNPVSKSNQLHLLLPKGNCTLTLVDAVGRTVLSKTISNNLSEAAYFIGVQDYTAGFYTIICETPDNIFKKKLIVN